MSSQCAPLGVSAVAPSDGDLRGVATPTVLLGLGDQGASSPNDVLAWDIPSARSFCALGGGDAHSMSCAARFLWTCACSCRGSLTEKHTVVREPIRCTARSPWRTTKAARVRGGEIDETGDSWPARRRSAAAPSAARQRSTTNNPPGKATAKQATSGTEASPKASTSHSALRPTANAGKATRRPAVPRTSTRTSGAASSAP
eukprot:CAMPEP_0204196462 /NCGR_PEP_ID=MMETSP0361-20130328/63838_1 /ASSEMBLY_ACC=CAM_ASM_000343 /TAXON_ID=268821 /ORGANISM="Scrippsiella Hangoei, Strain SHTV-5" /LENGTH=200 /DNA_ID=CAMNT_0051158211 /DNA_START=329 /DNA_END=928 /DNA_ORIENTATION=-